jgi:hypothetical protein
MTIGDDSSTTIIDTIRMRADLLIRVAGNMCTRGSLDMERATLC